MEISRRHNFLQMTFNTVLNINSFINEIKCNENENSVLNQDLRGKIDYDTEKCHAVTILKNVTFSKGFYL